MLGEKVLSEERVVKLKRFFRKEPRCFRTNGLAVCLAQPKNRRFAGLGYVRAHLHEGQRPGRLLRWFV